MGDCEIINRYIKISRAELEPKLNFEHIFQIFLVIFYVILSNLSFQATLFSMREISKMTLHILKVAFLDLKKRFCLISKV